MPGRKLGSGTRVENDNVGLARAFEQFINADNLGRLSITEMVPDDAFQFGIPRLGNDTQPSAEFKNVLSCETVLHKQAPFLTINEVRLTKDLQMLRRVSDGKTALSRQGFNGPWTLREEFKNGRSYYGLSDSRIALPSRETWQPSKELLAWHREEIFRG